MKRILLSKSKNYYKANLHCHSTKSDGKMTPLEIKNHYKSNGYSVVAFTDHEHLIDNSYLNDESFLAITGCEIAIKEFNHLSTLKKMDMKVCHLNFYAKEPSNINTPCYNSVYDHFITEDAKGQIVIPKKDYTRRYSSKGISKIIKKANEAGFFVAYNHPAWSLENAMDYLGYKGLWAVEIYNNTSNRHGMYEYDIHAYDDFLRADNRIACTFADDNHTIEDTLGGYVMINANELSYKAIVDALLNHNFYSSQGPVIEQLYIEDDMAYITYNEGEYVTMSTKGRRTQRIDAKNTAAFKIQKDDVYIRFDIVDKNGRRANTSAYFV